MYAVTASSEFYHLLADTDTADRTLCGLEVAPIIIDRPATTSYLHVTTERPSNYCLCEDCANIERKRILD